MTENPTATIERFQKNPKPISKSSAFLMAVGKAISSCGNKSVPFFFNEVPDDSYGNAASNVAHLYDLYRDDSPKALAPDTKSVYLRAYLEGIGTTSGKSDSLVAQGTGLGGTGVVARVEQTPKKIQEQLTLLMGKRPARPPFARTPR